jgi:hypothetical protein
VVALFEIAPLRELKSLNLEVFGFQTKWNASLINAFVFSGISVEQKFEIIRHQ